MTKRDLGIFVVAGIGGSASSLIDLATTLTRREPWSFGISYFIGVLIFFALGCVMAWVFEETDRRRALFVGLSMPALISSAQTQLDARSRSYASEPPSEVRMTFPRISSSVHAQTVRTDSENPLQDAREKTLTIDLLQECRGCVVVWTIDGKKHHAPVDDLSSVVDGSISVEVPLGVTGSERFEIGIWNSEINPKMWTLSSDGGLRYNFDYAGNPWNDIRRGLGNYNIRPFDPILTAPALDGQ